MKIWIENSKKDKAIDTIRRITGGDLSRMMMIGDPHPTPTLNVDQLKTRGIIGIYELPRTLN